MSLPYPSTSAQKKILISITLSSIYLPSISELTNEIAQIGVIHLRIEIIRMMNVTTISSNGSIGEVIPPPEFQT